MPKVRLRSEELAAEKLQLSIEKDAAVASYRVRLLELQAEYNEAVAQEQAAKKLASMSEEEKAVMKAALDKEGEK